MQFVGAGCRAARTRIYRPVGLTNATAGTGDDLPELRPRCRTLFLLVSAVQFCGVAVV